MLLTDRVRHQAGFQTARIEQRKTDGTEVIDSMQWEGQSFFDELRVRHEDDVVTVIGPFQPGFTLYDIVPCGVFGRDRLRDGLILQTPNL